MDTGTVVEWSSLAVMKSAFVFLALLGISLAAEPTVYFKEQFDDGDSWEKRWVHSMFKGSEAGKFKLTAGRFYGDAEKDKGIQTSTDAHFYHASAKFKPFSNEGKTLVLQFSVKHEQNIDCGGGYVKLYPADINQKKMSDDSPYYIMFGPDICGPFTRKVHLIFTYKDKHLLWQKDIRCKHDEYTHLYTLIVRPDNTYEVKIDNGKVESGTLEEDWDFLPPRKINDPDAKKPEDWDDRKKIDDPEDKKPEDWEKPEHIPDPEAEIPEDWDDEVDGEWDPPLIDNPYFKGEWKPKQIDNPAYKGYWVHPQIDNPEYSPDENLYRYTDIGAVGFDLFQVKSGTIFDNILVTDDADYAKKFAEETFGATKDAEKKVKAEQDEKARKEWEEVEMDDYEEEKEDEEVDETQDEKKRKEREEVETNDDEEEEEEVDETLWNADRRDLL